MPTSTPAGAPLVLVIRDGWGENPHPAHDAFNAIKLARTPVDDRLRARYPHTLIKTSGEDVGLPEGTMGNSEVGHQNIGAGRVVDQESVRITKVCRGLVAGGLDANEALVRAIRAAIDTRSYVHLMGICSDAGVHGRLEHLYALLGLCGRLGAERVAVHLFTDGRDTGPYTGLAFVREVETKIAEVGVGRIASVIGRYWAMDRDNRWERVERAYACLTGVNARTLKVQMAPSAEHAVQAHYDAPEFPTMAGDEFMPAAMVGADLDDVLLTRVNPGDTVVFYNYRGDRPRELVSAFVLPDFENSPGIKPSPDTGKRGFDRGDRLPLAFVTMTGYSEALAPYVKVAFPRPPRMVNIAGEHLAALGLTQFRCAETEKYPHVTFFFNDYRDDPFPGESRENPQSPRVATYDLRPEMAAMEVRDAVLARLAADDCEPLIVVNFANGDMVGHTGNLDAAVRACETVDECLGDIIDKTLARGGSLIVTADHGNAEQMWNPETDSPHTAHTTYDVPLVVVGDAIAARSLRGDADPANWFRPEVRAKRGRLADVIPTALQMLGLPQPPEMTGQSLLV